MRRMARPHRQPHEAQPVQQRADGAFCQRHAKPFLDRRSEVNTPPAHHTMNGTVRAAAYQRSYRCLLLA